MKRLFFALIALVLSTLTSFAWFIGGGELQGFHVNGGAIPSLTFLQCTGSDTNATTYTFNTQNVGTEGNRATIIGVLGEDNATVLGVDSVTVGGDSATEIIDQGATDVFANAAIYILNNPVGTSETVVVTFSEAMTGAAICLWDAKDLSSLTAVGTGSDTDIGGATRTLTPNLSNTSSDGVAVGVCIVSSGAAITWTWDAGLTERADTDMGSFVVTAGDLAPTTGGALSVTCDGSGTGTEDSNSATSSFR